MGSDELKTVKTFIFLTFFHVQSAFGYPGALNYVIARTGCSRKYPAGQRASCFLKAPVYYKE